jgi:hypothetical protein
MYIRQRRLSSILQAIEMTTDTVHHAHSNSAKQREETQTFRLLQESSSSPIVPFMFIMSEKPRDVLYVALDCI